MSFFIKELLGTGTRIGFDVRKLAKGRLGMNCLTVLAIHSDGSIGG